MHHHIALDNGLEGQLFLPRGRPGKTAVIILHERYGLVQHTLDLARKLADDGYVAFAPNLFAQWDGDKEALNAGRLRVILPDHECTRTIGQAIDLLRGDDRTKSEQICLMGVCQSGRYPLVVASQRDDISACIVFYGAAQQRDWDAGELQPLPMSEILPKVGAPCLFVFGETDHTISLDHVRRMRNYLEDGRKSYRMHVVADAPHGFLNDTMPGRYRPEDTRFAWRLLLDFLGEIAEARWPRGVQWEFMCDSSKDYDFSRNVRLE